MDATSVNPRPRWFRFGLRTMFAVVTVFSAYVATVVCGQSIAEDKVLSPNSIAAVVSSRLPSGWTASVEGKYVVIERGKRIEVFNGIGLPSHDPAEIRRIVRRERLVITLRLGPRVDKNEFEQIVQANRAATDKARKDTKRAKFMPDSKFWQEHPQYNYRELPTFDAGSQSIYMDCQPPAAVYPGRTRNGGSLTQFWDKKVEEECQGFIDDLGSVWQTYVPTTASGQKSNEQ